MPKRSVALLQLALLALSLFAFTSITAGRPAFPKHHLYRTARGPFEVGDKPTALALVDIAGDGFDDLLVGTAGRDRLQLLEISSGHIVATGSHPAGMTPTAIGASTDTNVFLVAGPGSEARKFEAHRPFSHRQNRYKPTAIVPLESVPVGQDPSAILITQMSISSETPEGRLRREGTIEYVIANRAFDEVSLIGRGRHDRYLRLMGTVPVGNSPVALSQSESGSGYVYVANSGSGTISLLDDGVFNGVVRTETIPVGGEPVAVGLGNFIWGDHRDEEIAVLDRAKSQVQILDRPPQVPGRPFEPYRVIQRHQVGDGPVALLVAELDDQYGTDIAVVNSLSDDVSVLLSTGARLSDGGTYATGHRPVAIEPIGYGRYFDGDLAVANRGSDDLTILIRNEFGRCQGHPARLRIGTASHDSLGGERGPNETHGKAGDDTISSGRETDCVHGGDGDDLISAGSNDDLIWAGPGKDRVDGQSGNDTIYAQGDGSDVIRCGSGTDTADADRRDVLRECEHTR